MIFHNNLYDLFINDVSVIIMGSYDQVMVTWSVILMSHETAWPEISTNQTEIRVLEYICPKKLASLKLWTEKETLNITGLFLVTFWCIMPKSFNQGAQKVSFY